nr:glycosyltransferase family 9 protein [Portibacter lacus]
MCTPVIRACKKQLYAEVHLLTKEKFKNVLGNNPHLDKIIHFKEKLTEIKNVLLDEEYDYIIDLHKNIRSRLVKTWLRKPSGTFPKLNFRKWLLVKFKIDKLPNLHIVDRYFKAYDKISDDGLGLEYHVREENKVDLNLGQYVAIVLGATYYTKRIPKEKLIEIIEKINNNIVLIGGPEEQALGKELSEQFEKVSNACGHYNLDQSASIVNQSKIVITSDTGMMHIASALKKHVIMVWGNTVPEFGMGPYQTEVAHFQVQGLKCRPCSKLGKNECPKGHFKCMMEQDSMEISSIANS